MFLSIPRCAAALLAATWLVSAANAQEKPEQAERYFDEEKQETVSAKEVTPGCPIEWAVHSNYLHNGRQKGVHLIYIDNGKLRIAVVPTRGMGILRVMHNRSDDRGGLIALGWRSPVEEIVNPAFMNLTARGGLGWL